MITARILTIIVVSAAAVSTAAAQDTVPETSPGTEITAVASAEP